ncbi:hypothetical protein [Desulfofustis limnaeus]|uniref:Uncharacterized protein n=1 Tax=Desulfofustis limnaeus TaxID=2740163 RepID=A0ABN6M744_9BACT|nr:hypothetical protein [Desulfofustis limnaeus]BDD88699.1 hypothetical protein DPPLL_30640 [Desulfofustis limnaeus]
MTITLGGLTLDGNLIAPDFVSASRASGSERLTLGRQVIIQRSPEGAGRLITLTARLDGSRLIGRFTREQVEQIRAWRDAGTVLNFTYHGYTADVVVRMDGVAVEAVGDRTDPPAGHPYTGTITLMEC